MKTNKWTKLLESVSTTLIKAYEKNVGVDLKKEVEVVAKVEKKHGLIEKITIGLISGLLICFLAATVYNWNEQRIINLAGLAVWLMTAFLMLLLIHDFFTRKDQKAIDSSLIILEAFEKVIEELDPADLNSHTIREVWVLDETDIKDNLAKLARKVLLAQSQLDFLLSCVYAEPDDVSFVEKESRILSERLTVCLTFLSNLEIDYSRPKAILDGKKLAGVKV